MLINVRDEQGKLYIKDILDFSFDMSVHRDVKGFFVQVNNKYRLDGYYESEADAEQKMLDLACKRNAIEDELKNY